ncbi:hypothetical protein E2562_023788 [Oryza meyeriana var. granulata]|uniref:DWNN domain-containing protein n=1 Tax=Oryza meyeriana var. granulata TaxID=110450 RepID=A0A6G1DMI9_9ORYZ|nr:hypothetical protein E2562_023788 [Oryza meyeriana var. granulata]
MAVYYRYKSGVDTFSVPVPEPSVSFAELKRLIMATARHGHSRSRGRGPRESVALYSDKTGDDDSTVVVRRRVAGPPAETIVELSLKRPLSQGGGSSSDSGATLSAPSTGAEGEEEKAISAVIDTAQLKWEAPTQGGHCYGHRGAHVGRAPPAGYVCHRCRAPGHLIQHCPTNGDTRFDIRRVAPAPASSPAPAASGDPDGIIPAELYCKICRKVMADAVLASKCCFDSFCDRYIRDHIAAKSKCACGAQARTDDLIPNTTLRTTIANLLATTGATSASSGTEKPRSSAGSNAAEPAPQSPTASQVSRNNVGSKKVEHSDGGASTSKKSATISGVLGPRKARETAGDCTAESGARAVDGNHHGAPFCPAPGYVDLFLGGMDFVANPYMYYGGVPYGCGGAAYGYYGE